MEMVSILMLAYNHEKWIEQAINSIVNQVTEYSFKLYIHDDKSTDGTRKIIEDFARQYPELIIAEYANENRYSRGIDPLKEVLFPMSKGKYIMLCEGDDYWVDDHKIDKQVRYLESNKDCHFCFANAKRIDVEGNYLKDFFPEKRWRDRHINKKIKSNKNENFSIEEMILLDFIPTASICCLREDYAKAVKFQYCLDITVRLVCASCGTYSHYFNEIFSAYRTGNVNSAGGSIRHSKEQMLEKFYNKHKSILENFDKFTNGQYNRIVEKEIDRKLLLVYLNTDFKNAITKKRFIELPLEKIAKEIGRNYFTRIFVKLKKLRYGNTKMSDYV